MAGERVIPGYGGGMSSAKAALESDTRTLAYEAGRRHGLRVNTISAGPLASRAASAIGIIDAMVDYCAANSPLPEARDRDRGRKRRRCSSRRRSRAGSPAPRSTWTRATTPWAWRWTAERRARFEPCIAEHAPLFFVVLHTARPLQPRRVIMRSAHWRGMALSVVASIAISGVRQAGASRQTPPTRTPRPSCKVPPPVLPGDTATKPKEVKTVVSWDEARSTVSRNYAMLGAAFSYYRSEAARFVVRADRRAHHAERHVHRARTPS